MRFRKMVFMVENIFRMFISNIILLIKFCDINN
jgi:hypothetical protein